MLYDRPYYREPQQTGLQGKLQTIRGWSAVKTLIVLNIVVFVLQQLSPYVWTAENFALMSKQFFYYGRIWTIVTAGFMHGDFLHILFNMIGLYVFGEMIERLYGKKWLLLFYFFCLIGSSLMVVGLDFLTMDVSGAPLATRMSQAEYEFARKTGVDVIVPTLGASGAVFGLLAAAALLFPNRQLILLVMFIIPVRIKIKWLALGYMGISVYGLLAGGSNVSHIGHLGGMLFGGGYFLAVKYGLISAGGGGYYGALNRQQSEKQRGVFTRLWTGLTKPFRKLHRSGWRDWPDHEIRAEMDRILAKVGQSGIGSLSKKEQQFLKDVSEYFRNRGR